MDQRLCVAEGLSSACRYRLCLGDTASLTFKDIIDDTRKIGTFARNAMPYSVRFLRG